MPTYISTQIEIAASPAEVRAAFLDFDSYPGWSKQFIKSITVVSGDKAALKPGDRLKNNDPELFKWSGNLPIIFRGDHAFAFTPSAVTPGHTTLVQGEEFTGLLAFTQGQSWSMGRSTKANFEAFNRDIKARVEGKNAEAAAAPAPTPAAA